MPFAKPYINWERVDHYSHKAPKHWWPKYIRHWICWKMDQYYGYEVTWRQEQRLLKEKYKTW